MMKAFVVRGDGGDVEEVGKPVPAEGEALVRVLVAGVCNTDLEILKGYMGFEGIVGHEFVGLCETPGPMAGKRVVGEINCACGTCGVCEEGGIRQRNHCPERSVLGILKKDGTYAEYLTLPFANLHVVPDTVTTENAAFAEPLAAAFRVIEQGLITKNDSVAIVGDGKLGLLVARVLCAKQKVTLFGRHASKMALIEHDNLTTRLLDNPASVTTTEKFDVVVDATGSPEGLDRARAYLRPLGTLVLKSTCAAGANFHTAPFVIDELKIVGSRCGPFEPALDLLATGLDLTPLISATFPLTDAQGAITKAKQKGTLKVQLRVSPD